jgi:hypothetical protein
MPITRFLELVANATEKPLSTREIGEILGVDHATAARDVAYATAPEEPEGEPHAMMGSAWEAIKEEEAPQLEPPSWPRGTQPHAPTARIRAPAKALQPQ